MSADHTVGSGVSTQDGSFYQQGRSERSDQSEARTRAIEESQTKINSYNEQARHYRELSRSLEQHASFAESSGFNLTQDLRNDLTRWYDKENAASPGGNMLPGLWETNLSSTQEVARNAAITKWAGQRSGGIERDIESALSDPALSEMKLPHVASEASVLARYSGGGPLGGAHPVSVERPDNSPERSVIAAGAREVSDDQRRLTSVSSADFAQAPPGAKKP